MVVNCGAYVQATFAKMEYMITGNWSCGLENLKAFAKQMFTKSQMAQTTLALELYAAAAEVAAAPAGDVAGAGVVCNLACTAQYMVKRAIEAPIQTPITLNIMV
jgi:hypothetical protein